MAEDESPSASLHFLVVTRATVSESLHLGQVIQIRRCEVISVALRNDPLRDAVGLRFKGSFLPCLTVLLKSLGLSDDEAFPRSLHDSFGHHL